MKLLFWIEPLVEMGRPVWKSAWVSEFAAGMIETLESTRPSSPDSFLVAAGATVLESLAPPVGASCVAFEERELRGGLESMSNLEITSGWYLGSFDQQQLETTAAVVRHRLGDFVPDVIVTHSPAPYLRRAFPDALILHREYGPFSRKPFTKTWYLDPCGMYRQGFAQRFATQIADLPAPTEEQCHALEDFRARCLELLGRRNPFRWWIHQQRRRFRHLVLLPLQFFGYYAIDANCPWRDPWEQLEAVLASVPREIGVVVTTHPEYNLLDDELVACLRRRHPHFLFHEHFENTYACSHFLLPEVDALLTVSSALGWQALVWKIPLVALGPCYRPLARGGLEDLERILGEPREEDETWPRWLLGHYAIPAAYLHDGRWLRAFLERSRSRWVAGPPEPTFFEPIAPLEEILAHHLSQLDSSVPHPGSSPSRDRLLERCARFSAQQALAPSAEGAIEYSVEEILAGCLAPARGGRWEEALARLDQARGHLERMLEWIGANRALVEQASAADAAGQAAGKWLDQADALDDPALAAQIAEKVLSLPALTGVVRARGERLLSRLARRSGRLGAAVDHGLRALAADPFQDGGQELLDGLLDAPEVLAAGRRAAEDLGLGEYFCLHLALAPPAGDQRWPGWEQLWAGLAPPLVYLGAAEDAPASGEARVLEAPSGELTAALLERALLVFVEDPASAVVCAAAGSSGVFLAREGWARLVDSSVVECLSGPWGRLRELAAADVLGRLDERLPGLVNPEPV